MKTNLWKLSCMALAMAAIVTGCNQNNELATPAPSSEEDVLNVVATANDFVSSDATSRVSETDYTTTFEEGDAIGVFVVRDGEALISNMKMTLGSDNAWAGENGAKLYYYKDADYIAYSPYTEGLSVTSEEEIITHFTTNLKNSTGQSTLADYQAADLMTAFVAAAEVTRGQNINFKFAHQMSMIEIKVPIRAYKTNGGYEYSAPLGLKVKIGDKEGFSLCTFGKETTGDAGSEVTKGIYRCIVAPSNTELNVEGEFLDGSAPVYFPATNGAALSVTPKAGSYKGFDVNYTYTGYTATRELKVGDYYYADGSIWPGDLGNAPKTGCVGIIFSTTVNEKALVDLGYNHGYVVSIVNAYHQTDAYDNSNNLGQYYKWGNSAANIWDIVSVNAEVLTTENGYERTYMDEKASQCYAAQIAKNFGSHEEQSQYLNPAKISGWFLPSSGLLDDLLHNLSGETGLWNETNGFSDSQMKNEKIAAFKIIQPKFTNVGGTFIGSGEIQDVTPNTERWWTITDAPVKDLNEYRAWSVELKLNGQSKFLERAVNGANASVRPVFAF